MLKSNIIYGGVGEIDIPGAFVLNTPTFHKTPNTKHDYETLFPLPCNDSIVLGKIYHDILTLLSVAPVVM